MKLWHASVLLLVLSSTQALGFFVDGEGNYGLKGETQTAPGFSKGSGTYQAIEQTFRLKGEARFNEQPESDTIMDVYEPYLMQLGFLQRTPRGRTTAISPSAR